MIAYFGYGSLVNLETLTTPYIRAVPAVLVGWRRHWQARPGDAVPMRALLSVHQDKGTRIGGMLVFDHASSLAALDEREHHYARVSLKPADLQISDTSASTLMNRLEDGGLFVYVGQQSIGVDPPLLQSYLHTVMDGFLNEYGEAGLIAFLETTDGFERPIIEDRHAPHYPRMTQVSDDRRAWFDRLLREKGVRFEAD